MSSLHSLDDQRRRDLSRTVMGLLESWGVSPEQQIVLLGLPADTRPRKLKQYQEDTPLPDSDELTVRIHYLLSIQKEMDKMFPHNPMAADYWVTTPNRFFNQRTPLDLMLSEGLNGLRMVIEHLRGSGDWGAVPPPE